MIKFILSSEPIYPSEMSRLLVNNTVGALVTFEGWVRNHNQGRLVVALEYEVYEILAQKEGEKILQEAQTKFNPRQRLPKRLGNRSQRLYPPHRQR